MIDRNEFKNIRNEMQASDLKREQVIQLSREIITLSKQIIYAAQRNELNEAKSAIKTIQPKVRKLRKIKIALDTNINSVAFQEYVEALSFYEFVKNKKIPTRKKLQVSAEN